jgi:hypothetical protein
LKAIVSLQQSILFVEVGHVEALNSNITVITLWKRPLYGTNLPSNNSRRRLREKVRFAKGERNWIRCGYKLLDHVYILNLTVNLSGTPVRDLIEPSP